MAVLSWRVRRQLRKLVEKERASPVKVPLKVKLQMWRRGFLSQSAKIYGKPADQLGDYLSDYQRFVKTPFINGDHAEFFNNKILFEACFGEGLNVPRNLGVVHKGDFLPLGREPLARTLDELIEYARNTGGLACKPFEGGAGYQVQIIQYDETRGFSVNEQPVSRSELDALFCEFHMIMACEFVRQAEYSRRIFPKTTNTIRIITMVDPDTREPFIARAVHRFGNRDSGPVDNWSQGALSVDIDVATGELGSGIGFPHDGHLVHHDIHPDTGVMIKGERIPHWERICQDLLEVVRRYSFIPYVGWDVVVTDEGFSILEGNSFTDVNLIQLHRPLLTDSRIRSFYEHYKVISPR